MSHANGAYHDESDSANEGDIYNEPTTPMRSLSLGHRGRSGLATPVRIALSESVARISAPSPVVDPNGLGWPGKHISAPLVDLSDSN